MAKKLYIVELAYNEHFDENGSYTEDTRPLGYFTVKTDAEKYMAEVESELRKRYGTHFVADTLDEVYMYEVDLNHGDTIEEILD